ncbi:MAG: hypothetical protein NVS3B28_24500 [Candidatus Velthaea sp.]
MQVVRRFSGVEVVEVEAKSILNPVTGMPFPWSINPYQGCFHQCVFCYARATHRYRELDGVTAWGSQIFAKVNAVEVVRSELRRHRRTIGEVAIGTATDPYQSVEGRYRITRGILRELSLARTPMHLITRSGLVVRDLDILTEYAARAPISVCISLPTLDERLARELEPTVAPPAKRLVAVRRLAVAGVRVGVAIAPVIPGLTDAPEAIADVVRAAADAGASFAWHGVLNLVEVRATHSLRTSTNVIRIWSRAIAPCMRRAIRRATTCDVSAHTSHARARRSFSPRRRQYRAPSRRRL